MRESDCKSLYPLPPDYKSVGTGVGTVMRESDCKSLYSLPPDYKSVGTELNKVKCFAYLLRNLTKMLILQKIQAYETLFTFTYIDFWFVFLFISQCR